jgi:biopolymer transport protein ExbD
MSASMSHGSSAEPNLTPMLDMVFQLVTFFMLVINFKAASLDLTLNLPVVGSAMPVDTQGKEELLILNVDTQGRLNVYGAVKDDINSYIAGEAQASLLSARREQPNIKTGDELPTMVVIRADKSTTFKLLYKVIKICQDHGYRRFALKAMNKEA